MFLYSGCYTPPNGSGQGIGLHRFDPESGEITTISTMDGIKSPTFLALGPQGDTLYSVGEMNSPQGCVVALRRDPGTGELTEINRQSSEGGGPCHLSIDASGRYVLVANYGTGVVSALPIRPDRGVGIATAAVQHAGPTGPNADRQDGPHAHQIMTSPDGRYVFANDLGLDRTIAYTLDPGQGTLVELPEAGGTAAAGAGPRHLAFAPDGATVYVINELGSTLNAYDYDASSGTFTLRQTLSTLPADFTGESYCAHVLVSPDGRFVYGSNRGHDSIAIFAVDEGDGTLTLLRTFGTGVVWPRNFTMTPDGAWFLVGNEKGDSVIATRRDAQTGLLSDPVTTASGIGSPVCLVLTEE